MSSINKGRPVDGLATKNAGIRVRYKDLRLVRLGDAFIVADITKKSIGLVIKRINLKF